jgi:hypothetical protein
VLIHLLNNDSVYPDSENKRVISDEECKTAIARENRWPRDARFLPIGQSSRMLSNIASISDFFQGGPRIIFVPPLIPTEVEWYGPGRLRRDAERSTKYRDTAVAIIRSMPGCEIIDIPWTDGSAAHQCGVLLNDRGGRELAEAVEIKIADV